jgi:hypothetical protein
MVGHRLTAAEVDGVERIANEHRFRSICDDGRGAVFNDFSGHAASGAQYNVLHAASCRWLARSNLAVPKIWFEDLSTATDWLVRERGAEGRAWKRCATCRARGSSTPPSRSADRPTSPSQPDIPGGRDPGYLIAADAAGSRVDAWSSTRLPFEPTGTMLLFRAGLRSAVAHLSAASGQALHALYTSPLGGRFDIENALLYNVGTSAFERSAGFELVVERRTGPGPEPPRSLPGAVHHYSYVIAQGDVPWQAWSIVRRLASFESEAVASPVEAAQPSSVWFAVRRGIRSILAPTDLGSPIGLELTVEFPDNAPANLATLTKPLIDGAIAAFHEHDDPASLDLVAERLQARIGAPAAEVRSLLARNEAAILGSRRLLWPWRDGVQWNPADDRCAAFRIRRLSGHATGRNDRTVRIRGSLVRISRVLATRFHAKWPPRFAGNGHPVSRVMATPS